MVPFIFAAAAAVLWISVFGYAITLALITARRRNPPAPRARRYPEIAVVVPTLNEAALITSKLKDLQRTEYPSELVTVLVVDGGSTDGTIACIEAERSAGTKVELLRVQPNLGKAEQVNRALSQLRHDLVVVTDADARLDPQCIGHLIDTLVADERTAVVGARVRPQTNLLEERLHWWAVNNIWWLEGEALDASLVSGVCYAVRRQRIEPIPTSSAAEDVHLALRASERGWRARLSPDAIATELRVPQTRAEFLRFRKRRGERYARELLRPVQQAPFAWRLARAMRLFHFFVTPKLLATCMLLGLVLLCGDHWLLAVSAAAAFVTPALIAVQRSTTLASSRLWQLGLAAGQMLWLIPFSLFVSARGGSLRPSTGRAT